MQSVQEGQIARIESEIADTGRQITAQREEDQKTGQTLDQKRGQLQSSAGRKASLEALQQAALGLQEDTEVNWLNEHGFSGAGRLGEYLEVEAPWHNAVETVLGDHLQAVCVDELESVTTLLAGLEKGSIEFAVRTVEPVRTAVSEVPGVDYLLDKVKGATDLSDQLRGIRISDNLESALEVRANLQPGESVITPEGIWIGQGWVRVNRGKDSSTGVIRRQEELNKLASLIASLEEEVQVLEQQKEGGQARVQVLEEERDKQQNRLAEQQRAYGETRARLGATRLQLEQRKADLEKALYDLQQSEKQLQEDEVALAQARNRLETALDQMEHHAGNRASLVAERETNQRLLSEARSQAARDREQAHQLALKVQSISSSIASLKEAMRRLEDQQGLLKERRDTLEKNLRDGESPGLQLREELDHQLDQRSKVEEQLAEMRRSVETIEHRIREQGRDRNEVEELIEGLRAQLEQLRIDRQSLNVRQMTIQEAMREEEVDLDSVRGSMPEEANEDDWEESLTKIQNRIQRLGAINLAAVEEFKLQSERKEYLDAQNEDLEKALTTLQNAIRKIDIETRTRFKETFDKINSRLQQLFPKLFGGGHAYLEMTGEDLLDTGVGLMARPPGKRNTSIHLLSGGEKALTAIALVFSIFSLNPAPFCLLDEVDAPLDDTNVGRYSDLVKEMSRSVQFVYITHNKIAMEMAEQLMGVTMHEPGVSRLVTVDVDEAVAMAAV